MKKDSKLEDKYVLKEELVSAMEDYIELYTSMHPIDLKVGDKKLEGVAMLKHHLTKKFKLGR